MRQDLYTMIKHRTSEFDLDSWINLEWFVVSKRRKSMYRGNSGLRVRVRVTRVRASWPRGEIYTASFSS